MAPSSTIDEEVTDTGSASHHVPNSADALYARPGRSGTGSRAKGRTPMAAESFAPGEPALVHSASSSTLARLMAIFRQPPMRYQNTYVWLLLAASLDIMRTWIVLVLGGEEVNWLADRVLEKYHFPGMIAFKFGLVVFVILMCEFIGRMRDQTGRRLAVWLVVINFLPVVWTITQLLVVMVLGDGVAPDDKLLLQISHMLLVSW